MLKNIIITLFSFLFFCTIALAQDKVFYGKDSIIGIINKKVNEELVYIFSKGNYYQINKDSITKINYDIALRKHHLVKNKAIDNKTGATIYFNILKLSDKEIKLIKFDVYTYKPDTIILANDMLSNITRLSIPNLIIEKQKSIVTQESTKVIAETTSATPILPLVKERPFKIQIYSAWSPKFRLVDKNQQPKLFELAEVKNNLRSGCVGVSLSFFTKSSVVFQTTLEYQSAIGESVGTLDAVTQIPPFSGAPTGPAVINFARTPPIGFFKVGEVGATATSRSTHFSAKFLIGFKNKIDGEKRKMEGNFYLGFSYGRFTDALSYEMENTTPANGKFEVSNTVLNYNLKYEYLFESNSKQYIGPYFEFGLGNARIYKYKLTAGNQTTIVPASLGNSSDFDNFSTSRFNLGIVFRF